MPAIALLSLATIPAHASPTQPPPTRAVVADAQRVERGMRVLSELTGGGSQPVFESMRRDFPFLADATAGYALNAGASREESKEIVDLLAVPAGFPRAIDASQALQELFRRARRQRRGSQALSHRVTLSQAETWPGFATPPTMIEKLAFVQRTRTRA